MLRGAEIGGIAGLALGGLALLAISEQGQCYTAPSTVPGLEGCSENLTAGKANKIFFGGGVLGAVIGSVLGYTYHVNVNEQRAARCRATPSACA
jgi:ABC-type lipoprotein release transport system permease subunit